MLISLGMVLLDNLLQYLLFIAMIDLSITCGTIDALRPMFFTGVNFKRWQIRVTLWINTMNVFWVSEGKPEGELDTIFCGVVVGVLAGSLQDTYLHYKTTKEMWNTLSTEYEGLDAGTELYIIEQYHDY
jgi:hypothetical protein